MIMDFSEQMAALAALGVTVPEGKELEAAMVLFRVFDRGVAFERSRCLDIIARKAMNASELRAEINRPVR